MSYDLSCAAVGRLLRKSPAAVARLIHSGDLAAIKTGRTYRVRQADLDAYLDRARVRPRPTGETSARRAVANHWHETAARRCEAAGI